MSQIDNTSETRNWVNSPLFAALCIAVLGAVIYGHTLHAPWYLDDTIVIVRNPAIRDLHGVWRDIFAQRGLAMFSFALNYHFHGLELPGYHVVNILIHLVTTFLVYLNLKRVFRNQPVIALSAALLFLAHPLQTQSVTYIVQRMTCLSGLFFFLSLYLYVRARETLSDGKGLTSFRHGLFYLLSLLSGAVAVYTKQNAAILPFCILLFDRFFLPRPRQSIYRQLCYLLPYFAAPVWMALSQFVFPVAGGKSLLAVTSTVDTAKEVQVAHGSDFEYMLSYLVTEFSVFWLYVRLLFLPYGQVLEYEYPFTAALLTIKNVLAFSGMAALFVWAVSLRKRFPLASFGILWFFVALSVESTIIPMHRVFEHRLYVPMFGFVVLVPQIFDRLKRKKAKIIVICSLVAIYSVLTWFRNDLWSREKEFYEDQYAKVPHSPQAMMNLSKIYFGIGRDQEAEALLRKVIRIEASNEMAYVNLSKHLIRKQRLDEALRLLQQGLQANPNSSELYNGLGVLHDLQGKPEQAITALFQAIRLAPIYPESYTNLGVVYVGLKRWTEAERYFRSGLAILDENPKAHYNLGVTLYFQGRLAEAADSFRRALKYAPDDASILFNLASTSLELGRRQEALELLPALRLRDKALALELENELAKQQDRPPR